MLALGAATTVSIFKSAKALVVVLPAVSMDLTLTLKSPLVRLFTAVASKVRVQVEPVTVTAGDEVLLKVVLEPPTLAKITSAVVPASKVPVNCTPSERSVALMMLSLATGRVNTGVVGATVSITTFSDEAAVTLPAVSVERTTKPKVPWPNAATWAGVSGKVQLVLARFVAMVKV